MDEFIGYYLESNIEDCDLDVIDDTTTRINKIKAFNLTLKFISSNPIDKQWQITLTLHAKMEFHIKFDIFRWIHKEIDLDTTEINKFIFAEFPYSRVIDLFKCITDIQFLHTSLKEIIPGYEEPLSVPRYVLNFKSHYAETFDFILNILMAECFSGKWIPTMAMTLKPLPAFITQIDQIMFNRMCTGIDLVRELIYNPELDIPDDKLLYQTSWLGYEIIKCALVNFNIYSLARVPIFEVRSQFSTNPGIKIYKVNHNNPGIYTKFDNLLVKKGHIAYHGSSIANWYSIMYNSLFVAKGSLIQNGAAYGNGIYMSDSSLFSIGYCMKNKSDNIILGIFQVDKDIGTYKKANNIYVIPQPENICLRYLVYLKYSIASDTTLTSNLDNYFINGKVNAEMSKTVEITSKVWSRRLMLDIRELHARDGIMGADGLRYIVNLDDTNSALNIIHLSVCQDSFVNSIIGSDMESYGVKFIKFEFRLSENYPFEPPFVRVLTPKLAFRTGHITVGGSVCIDILTKQRWTATISIPNILITIIENMKLGGGRLDPNGINYTYSLAEAQSSYTRMLSTHAQEWD